MLLDADYYVHKILIYIVRRVSKGFKSLNVSWSWGTCSISLFRDLHRGCEVSGMYGLYAVDCGVFALWMAVAFQFSYLQNAERRVRVWKEGPEGRAFDCALSAAGIKVLLQFGFNVTGNLEMPTVTNHLQSSLSEKCHEASPALQKILNSLMVTAPWDMTGLSESSMNA